MMAFPEYDGLLKDKTQKIRSMSFSDDRLSYEPHKLDITVLLVPFYALFFSNHVIVAVTFNRVSDF